MTTVLLIGVGPLPAPQHHRVYAPGLRLNAFLEALIRANCHVMLGELLFAGIENNDFSPKQEHGVIEHRRLGPSLEEATDQINSWTKQSPPDAVVALTDMGSMAVVQSDYTGPLHVDYFGHPMAERQQQAFVHQNNASLHEQWLSVLPVLLRADRFSACSNAQRLALTGELGAVGRLNAETCGHEFVEIVPPTLPFNTPYQTKNPSFLKEKGIPESARVIFASGGYNTWVDEETLFKGIEKALKDDDNLHFVSTGGAIQGHVEVIYERFVQRINNSSVRNRFHLLGWVTQDELFDCMLTADVAVNCDRWSLEGEFGCRNRLYGWLWGGLRVVTTVSSDPTRDLVEQGWVVPIKDGDWESLGEALVTEANKGRHQDLNEVQKTLRAQWGGENFFQELAIWANAPKPAPDRTDQPTVENPLTHLYKAFQKSAQLKSDHENLLAETQQLAQTLLGSRAMQLYLKLHPDLAEKLNKLKD